MTSTNGRRRKETAALGILTGAAIDSAATVAGWWEAMRQYALASLSVMALTGMAAIGDCDAEVATAKGEVKVLSPDVTGVKVEFNVNTGAAQSPPSMDESAGQKGRTEYEGRKLNCRDEIDGTQTCW